MPGVPIIPTTQEAEKGSEVQGQLRQHNKVPSQKNLKRLS